MSDFWSDDSDFDSPFLRFIMRDGWIILLIIIIIGGFIKIEITNTNSTITNNQNDTITTPINIFASAFSFLPFILILCISAITIAVISGASSRILELSIFSILLLSVFYLGGSALISTSKALENIPSQSAQTTLQVPSQNINPTEPGTTGYSNPIVTLIILIILVIIGYFGYLKFKKLKQEYAIVFNISKGKKNGK